MRFKEEVMSNFQPDFHEVDGVWTCQWCGREISAMAGDSEIPMNCNCIEGSNGRIQEEKPEYKFICPKCDGNQLVEVMVNVVQESNIVLIYHDEDNGLECDYGEVSHDDGYIDHWSCGSCYKTFSSEDDVADCLEKIE